MDWYQKPVYELKVINEANCTVSKCSLCGSLVEDCRTHNVWHESIAAITGVRR